MGHIYLRRDEDIESRFRRLGQNLSHCKREYALEVNPDRRLILTERMLATVQAMRDLQIQQRSELERGVANMEQVLEMVFRRQRLRDQLGDRPNPEFQ